MVTIDAHQHFWNYDPVRDSWITPEMGVIRRDFLPVDLAPVLKENNVDGCVAVQACQTEAENDFLLSLAANASFIKGVVGWVDLRADNIDERLQHYKQYDRLKGFRHVLQGEADRALMLKPEFKNGISKLAKYGYTYDILIFTDQINYATELVAAFPDQKFVLDHIAKPLIKDGDINDWAKDINALARHENVWCKLSGMVTEADWKNWETGHFTPYLDVVTAAFGTTRLMYGSDWPVCQVAATYGQVKGIVDEYARQFSKDEQKLIFGGNAVSFYNL